MPLSDERIVEIWILSPPGRVEQWRSLARMVGSYPVKEHPCGEDEPEVEGVYIRLERDEFRYITPKTEAA